MPTEKTASTEKTGTSNGPFPFAMTEWWKPQTAALQSLYAEALTLAEVRLRKQADLLHDLAGAKSFPDALKVQTRFVQDLWDESTQQATRAFSSMRNAAGGGT